MRLFGKVYVREVMAARAITCIMLNQSVHFQQQFKMAASNSLFSVANKNVLITGGSRGIGFMIAKIFAHEGANVLLTSRSETACSEARDAIGGNCRYVPSNLGSRSGCESLAKYAHDTFGGRLDVLVNNAGAGWGEDPYGRESGKANWGWDKVIDLNVKGVFYLTRACVSMMEGTTDLKNPSRVINIGSVAGMLPQGAPTHAYDVSKAALHHLTKKMANDLAPKGITVNAIAPGFVLTRMSKGLGKWGNSKELGKTIPLGRMGDESDMAGACIYLSSRAGAWCTGIILNVDGGTVGCMQIPLSSL